MTEVKIVGSNRDVLPDTFTYDEDQTPANGAVEVKTSGGDSVRVHVDRVLRKVGDSWTPVFTDQASVTKFEIPDPVVVEPAPPQAGSAPVKPMTKKSSTPEANAFDIDWVMEFGHELWRKEVPFSATSTAENYYLVNTTHGRMLNFSIYGGSFGKKPNSKSRYNFDAFAAGIPGPNGKHYGAAVSDVSKKGYTRVR